MILYEMTEKKKNFYKWKYAMRATWDWPSRSRVENSLYLSKVRTEFLSIIYMQISCVYVETEVNRLF